VSRPRQRTWCTSPLCCTPALLYWYSPSANMAPHGANEGSSTRHWRCSDRGVGRKNRTTHEVRHLEDRQWSVPDSHWSRSDLVCGMATPCARSAARQVRDRVTSQSGNVGTRGSGGTQGRNGSATSISAWPQHPHTGLSAGDSAGPGEVPAVAGHLSNTAPLRPGGDATASNWTPTPTIAGTHHALSAHRVRLLGPPPHSRGWHQHNRDLLPSSASGEL
jgi:hypothetical protein